MSKHAIKSLALIAALAPACSKDRSSGGSPDDAATTSILPGAVTVIDRSAGGSATDADQVACQAAADSLAPTALLGTNADQDHVAADLVLPAQLGDITVTWSSAHAHIDADGVVTRPAAQLGDIPGSLEATFSRGNARVVRGYSFTVLRGELNDADSVTEDKAALTPAAVLGANATVTRITANLTLPATGAHGSTITWSSANAAIADTGVVTRPAYTSATMKSSGVLTATVTKNAAAETATFDLTVIREAPPLQINEVYGGFSATNGWIEVLNTTGAAIDLSQYGWRSCAAGPCSTLVSGTLPAVTLPAGKYILIHPSTAYQIENGPHDIFLTGLELFYGQHFFELTSGGTTVDFVRWSSGAALSISPTTGTFTGLATMTTGTAGESLERTWPQDDTDSKDDWAYVIRATPGGPNGTGAVLGTDSDHDGLTDDYETNVSHTDPTNPDTDGDWFSDGQEVLDAGIAGINIKALGADPLVRDIFMELDYMAPPVGGFDNLYDSTINPFALKPRKAALDRVVEAFASYVPGAGQYPIKIHFDTGTLFNTTGAISPENYDLGGGNEIPFVRCISLGRDMTHTASTCADLYGIKQQNFDAARRYVFHYFVVGWSQLTDGSAGSSGLAEVGGNDGIITIGSWDNDGQEQLIVNWQAATIFHELGHNLGLKHGGNVDMNYKPNYMSTMNYSYQLRGIDTDDDGDVFYNSFYTPTYSHPLEGDYDRPLTSTAFVLDYSHGVRAQLDEAHLNETTGWNNTQPSVAIDFTADGMKTGTDVAANINPSYNATSTDVMSDYDDWSSLNLIFQQNFSAENSGNSLSFLDNLDEDRQPTSAPCLSRPSP